MGSNATTSPKTARSRSAAPSGPRNPSRKKGKGSAERFRIVGVGASAGGLDAFRKLFTSLPDNPGAAFVLVQHLDPTRDSLAVELVGSYTGMPVAAAADGMAVEVNHVYVIPPNAYLSIRDRILRLSLPTEPRTQRMAVDYFLESLAADEGERAIAIVLSGSGTDGTQGLKAVRKAGGLTIVQDPTTAEHDGMPRSAMGSADHVLAIERMADVLFEKLGHEGSDAADLASTGSDSDPLDQVFALLLTRTKIDFRNYKKGTLTRRIRHRMGVRHVAEMAAYIHLLREDADEVTSLFKDLLINVTSFFREPAAWQVLQERVIRSRVAAKGPDDSLRVWVPACSSGEEAYSVAIACVEEVEASGKSCRVQIFASDIDAEALEIARVGVYPETIASQVGPARLKRFFVHGKHGYRVTKELRDLLVFAQHGLLNDPPFSKLDLVTCRNLLIYLEPSVQERLIPLLHFALLEGGTLFLGSAEGIGSYTGLFEAVSAKWRIYRRIGPTRHEKLQFPLTAATTATVRTPSHNTRSKTRLSSLAEHLLLQRYAPACVIVNRGGDVLFFHGRTSDYLAQPDGVPTQSLMALARDGLGSKLSNAFHEALSRNERIVVSGVQVRRGNDFPSVRITAEPLQATRETEDLWLVSLEDESPPQGIQAAAPAEAHASDALVRQLEYELKTGREDLQQGVEELRAANEELMSINEELQSSNEELETSKEELQSLNEELTTANTQLEGKIREVEAANNDLDNLLTSTNIATLFLDRNLRIRRFTPAATRLFSLIASDIGRPIGDVAQKFTDPGLLTDAADSLEHSTTPRQEVQAHDGRWYVRQVLPYRTRDNDIEGVVITLSDVAAEALLEARLFAEAIVGTVREPLLVLDDQLRVVSANRSFHSTFRISEKETVGELLYELGKGEWDIPELRTLLGEVLPQRHVMDDFAMEHDFISTIGPRKLLLNARALVRGGDRPALILLAIEDVTERRRLQDALLESETTKRNVEEAAQRQAELARALRISTIGELATGLAHELHQPLSAIAYEVEACARYVRAGTADPAKLLALLDEASSEALRAGEIVGHLRLFIEKGTPQLEATDLGEIAGSVARLMRHQLEAERTTLKIDVGPRPLPIQADRIQIEQILVNLIQNAVASLGGLPVERRQIEIHARAADGMAEIRVKDVGSGIAAAAAKQMFEPFFTTRTEGLGMGLSISRSIIEAHRGRIWAEPAVPGEAGTTVCFALPLESKKPSRKRRGA